MNTHQRAAAANVEPAVSGLVIEDFTTEAARHPDFAGHEKVLLGRDPARRLTAIIAIHSTKLGPAIGGTRIWKHPSFDAGLADVLRLSHGMTLKAAIAGLPHGGGKAIILADPKTEKSRSMLEAYAEMLAMTRGLYYTAEDVGLTLSDADFLRALTPNVLGTTAGGSRNPSPVTAYGVYLGIRAAVRHRFGREAMEGLTFAVQGLGAVGSEVARRIRENGGRLIVADVSPERLTRAREEWGARIVDPSAILSAEANVLVPCALGGALNGETIPALKVRVVAGAANNQLQAEADAETLREHGILYAPDYVINGAGLMNVAAELEPDGYDQKKVLRRVEQIPAVLAEIFRRADQRGLSTEAVAEEMARERLA